MVKPEVMLETYGRFRQRVSGLFANLLSLASEVGVPGLREVAAATAAGVNAPFLFVVVGEVKAGKSSFINALLGDEICAVAPDPCTDTIQKIVHAEKRGERKISEHVREIGLPSDILREIAIVDTPGTNSIIERHQEITEDFIPEADLVVFVLPALNPYARTSWDFFEFVAERWHKKIIFILQQADRASPEELAVNERRVAEYAGERGIENPRIFRVSARLAREGEPGSGMEDVWEFIRTSITGGRQYLLKMDSLLTAASDVLERLDEELARDRVALARDAAEAERIRRRLERGREYSQRDVDLLQARLLETYATISADITARFQEGLGLGRLVGNSIKGVFGRRNGFRDWLEGLNREFSERLLREVDLLSREAAARVGENISRVTDSLLDELESARQEDPAGRVRGLNVTAVTRKRFAVVDEVIANVLALLADDSLSDRLRPAGLEKIGDQAMVGGFITAVGAIIAATTHAVVFDVTGGVFTTVGALLAINTLALKRRSIVRRYREGFEQGREQFERELSARLSSQLDAIFRDLTAAFEPFFDSLTERDRKLAELERRSRELGTALTAEHESAVSSGERED